MKPYLYKYDKTLPIYRGRFVILLSNEPKKVERYIPDFNRDHIYATTLYREWKDGTEAFVIVLNLHNSHRPVYPGTIAHEAVHAAHMVGTSRGIQPDFENDEPITYLVEWMVDQIAYFIEKKGFKIASP